MGESFPARGSCQSRRRSNPAPVEGRQPAASGPGHSHQPAAGGGGACQAGGRAASSR